MYQAGTLSGNPLAMVAGIKTLEILGRPGAYEHLDAVTGRLINGLLDAGRAAGHALTGGHISGAQHCWRHCCMRRPGVTARYGSARGFACLAAVCLWEDFAVPLLTMLRTSIISGAHHQA